MPLTARISALRANPFFPIWPATAALFLISPLLAPGSITETAVVGMLPFASILAIAAIGQTLVVQQRGLDLSVPGMISLAAIIVTVYPNGDDARIPAALLLVALSCVVAGLISGLAITRFGITPLVATLGVNALLIGAIIQLTNGASTATAAPVLDEFAFGRLAGIPNTVVVAIVAIGLVAVIVRSSVVGRRLVAVGANPTAAHVAGIPIRRYQLGTYVVASLSYGLAGVLLAGFLRSPQLLVGNEYLLPTIAAVVLGGTSLVGGNGSVVATAVGALFLTQLEQVVLGMGGPSSVQLVIQGLIIAIGMAARNLQWRQLVARLGPPTSPGIAAPAGPVAGDARPADRAEGGGR